MDETQISILHLLYERLSKKSGILRAVVPACCAGEEQEFRGVLRMDEKARIL